MTETYPKATFGSNIPMTKPRILLTTTSFQDTPGEHHKMLAETGWEVVTARGPLNEADTLALMGQFDGYICGDDMITAAVIEKALPRLKVVSKYGIGVDKIDVKTLTAKGIPLLFTPGVNHTTVAEHTFLVNPDAIVKDHGADALRMYLMFLGPLEASKPWNSDGIIGITRFLKRLWRLAIDENTGKASAKLSADGAESEELVRELHRTIQKVEKDIETLQFNTAISQMMILMNVAEKSPALRRVTVEDFVRLAAPFAPHVCEEIWARLGHKESITAAGWPKLDASKLIETTVEVIFQVNGKVRATAKVAKDISKDALLALAKANTDVIKFTDGKPVVKEIVVPGKLVNIVVAG